MIVTRPKAIEQVISDLHELDATRIAVIGCGECATTAGTGGITQVKQHVVALEEAGFEVIESFVSEKTCESQVIAVELAISHCAAADAILMLSCGAGAQVVSDALPTNPVVIGLDSIWWGTDIEAGSVAALRCCQCGACTLTETAGICLLTACPKGLSNGPCGGMWDGMCEVMPEQPCVHVLIRQRLIDQGRIVPNILPPRDFSDRTGGAWGGIA